MGGSIRRPLCVVLGTGRMAGGFVAPVLADAGWSVLLVGRDPSVVRAIRQHGRLTVRVASVQPRERLVPNVSASNFDDPATARAIVAADLLATTVGPSALDAVGRWLAPRLARRSAAGGAGLNIIAFENHRRAPQLLLGGMLNAEPALARALGRHLGIGGAAVWRAIAHREVTHDGVRYDVDDVDECYVDAMPLLPDLAPHDGSVPGLDMVRSFDERMVEKLWVFNAGHAAAAYLGWAVGVATISDALQRPDVRQAVAAVVEETQVAFAGRRATRGDAEALPRRTAGEILSRYADRGLADNVTRVGREPRRKLAPDDRLVGPALACQGLGLRPVALATAIAAALAYAEPSDAQAAGLQAELRYQGPDEVLATVSGLHPSDELSRLVCEQFRAGQVELPVSASLGARNSVSRRVA